MISAVPDLVAIKDKLPEAYGTERVFLTARDPHWLYASWDLTAEQHRGHVALARDGRLLVRCYLNDVSANPVAEAQASAESRSWFFHVERAAARYVAELGYFDTHGRWTSIATSTATFTPPDSLSEAQTAEFATIPPEVTLSEVFQAVQAVVTEHPPLAQAVPEFQPEAGPEPFPLAPERTESPAPPRGREPGPVLPQPRPRVDEVHPGAPAKDSVRVSPAPPNAQPKRWTAEQRQALAELVHMDQSRRVWMGSMEITELIRRHLEREISSPGAPAPGPAGPGQLSPIMLAGISSPLAGEIQAQARRRGFWFNLNAELVLYGATEVDARVRIAGRQIRLRPDGTFSYRFALPDGRYPLAVSAESADGIETLSTQLQFSRRTEHQGPVGVHPQDPKLRTPANPDLD
jgi:uncharacterized protein